MKFFTKLLLILLFAIPSLVFAQTVVQVGAITTTNSASNNAGPIYRSSAASAFDFSHQYYLYTAAELATAGITPGSVISKIAFYKVAAFGTVTTGNLATWKIYMKNSGAIPSATWSVGSFATQNAGATLVYNGNPQAITATGATWITLTFATPFTYTGGSLEVGSDWDCSLTSGNPSTGGFTWGAATIATQTFGGSNTSSAITMTSQTSRPGVQFTYVAGATCTGAPVAGTTTSSTASACSGVNFSLGLSGATAAGGLTYQWESSPAAAGTFSPVAGATAATLTTSLTAATDYRCVVTCTGSAMSSTSTVKAVGLNTFINCYCTATATSTADDDIARVTFGSLANPATSPSPLTSNTTANGTYTNFSALAPSDFTQGVSYPMSVQAYFFGATSYANWVTAYIDYNQNGIFEATEVAFSQNNPNATPFTTTGSVLIPLTASLGNTRMRVILVESASALSSPCASFSWGEVEDYTINILPSMACTGAPTQSTATASTTVICSGGSSNLTATNLPTATGITYEWQVSTDAGTTWTGTGVATATYAPTGITMTSEYRYVATCTATGDKTPSTVATVTVTAIGAVTTATTSTSVCPGSTVSNATLSVTGAPAGVTYQWQVSIDAGATFANVSGTGTTATYAATVTTASVFNCLVSCGAATVTSSNVSISVLAGCACIPTYSTGKTLGDLISNISISGTTLSNNSGTAQVNPAYTFFTGQPNYTGTLAAGTQYTVNVTIGTYGAQGIAAWIDYNDNYVFEASEKIGFTAGTIGTGTGSFPIPAANTTTFIISLACNPSPGVHRMRIRDVWNQAGNLIDPCTLAGYGETEDYDITVAPPPPCPQPSALTATAATTTGATLGWVIGCAETAWDLEILPASSTATGTPTNVSVSTNPYVATGLLPSTLYQYYVRAKCGSSSVSAWSGPFNFGTLIENDDPCNATTLVLGAPFICQNTVAATPNTTITTGIEPSSNLGTLFTGTTGSAINNTVWFKYVPAVTGTFRLNVSSPAASTTPENTWVGIYTTDCAVSPLAFTQVMAPVGNNLGAGLNVSTMTPSLTAGTTYYFVVDGQSGSVGDFCIRLEEACQNSASISQLTQGNNLLPFTCDDGSEFTFYGTGMYSMGVKWGTNTAAKLAATANIVKYSAPPSIASAANATFILPSVWNVTAPTQPTTPVTVRFYYSQADSIATANAAQAFATSVGGTVTAPVWFKSVSGDFDPSNSIYNSGQGSIESSTVVQLTPTFGTHLDATGTASLHFVEFMVTSFSGGTEAVGAGGLQSPLPVVFKNFKGFVTGNTNTLAWEAGVQLNTKEYRLERSVNGRDWSVIATVASNATLKYSTIDANPVCNAYYRVIGVDNDGKTWNTQVINVTRRCDKFNITSAYPVPTAAKATVQYESVGEANVSLTLTDLMGRVMFVQNNLNAKDGFNNVEVDLTAYTSGTYFVTLNNGTDQVTQRLIKE